MKVENGNQMIENASQDAMDQAIKNGKLTMAEASRSAAAVLIEKKKAPEGTVTRTLNMRDRNQIGGALQGYVKGEKARFKGQYKLDRILKLLCFQETMDYYDMVNDSQAENLFLWQETKAMYFAWRNWKGGVGTLEDLRKQYPKIDSDTPPKKPSIHPPRLSEEEERGPAREFFIPSKLDSFIQDALRATEWNPYAAKYVVELMVKYGIIPEGSVEPEDDADEQ
jgi:hypothetical protein